MWNWIANNWSTILDWGISIVAFASFIFAVVKNVKDKQFNKVAELIPGLVQSANVLKAKDGTTNISGEAKKQIVMAQLMVACTNFGVKYNEKELNERVEKAVNLMNTERNQAAKAAADAEAEAQAQAQAKK